MTTINVKLILNRKKNKLEKAEKVEITENMTYGSTFKAVWQVRSFNYFAVNAMDEVEFDKGYF